MSWTLQNYSASRPDAQKYKLRNGSTTHIVLLRSDGSVGIAHELRDPDVEPELGRITVTGGVAKLEAISGELIILPGANHSVGHKVLGQAPLLKPLKDGRVEILLLRDADIISSSQAEGSVTCTWETASEVQVNSSAAETGAEKQVIGLDEATYAAEDETEDEDLDQTSTTIKATQSKSQPLQPTTQLSEQRSVVVQETPTTFRFGNAAEYPELNETDNRQVEPVDNTPTPDGLGQIAAQPYSTARTGQSQQQAAKSADDTVEIPVPDISPPIAEGAVYENQRGKRGAKVVVARKRTSAAPDNLEPDTEHIEQSNKRAKRNPTTDDDTQGSSLSNIIVDTSPTVASAKKGRKRKSTAHDIGDLDEGTPRSHRSSQRAASVTNADSYRGETPCVATSNSAITEKSHAAKFLKKQGGCLVDSVKDVFNVLCVRDGELVRTSKVLQAIAAGIAIVTDKWLLDSAKAGRFLSVDAYKPHAPEQEEEWDIKLDNVLGQPQTPFNGYTLHFTTSAHAAYKPFADIEHVCKTAGAKITTKKKIDKNSKTVVIAADESDKEAEKLIQDGIACYYRGILPMSILRGTLDLGSQEFKVGSDDNVTTSTAKDAKTKRGRKS
ncbi:hypothetical protein DE146DRAFT_293797 [Phaeosphaeria sp. MPI-PUGE-AT-0046c]|nr:hypothetical protein DE146DRAFT_293797 [Phaeosphaeria sp. MPI-PUGE-AT-0046c]